MSTHPPIMSNNTDVELRKAGSSLDEEAPSGPPEQVDRDAVPDGGKQAWLIIFGVS